MTEFELNQRTVAMPVSCRGVGLHTGKAVTLTLVPAPVDHGVAFVRTDLPDAPPLPARSSWVVDGLLATSLGRAGVKVGTVEHLLAAVYASGIDNLRIELDGPEVPVMDGSAAPFMALLDLAGVCRQLAPRRFLRVRRPVSVRDGDKHATLYPARGFHIDCAIDFEHPVIARQSLRLEVTERAFSRELARARTFGFVRDMERLERAGLAKGASLENAVVLDEAAVVNPEGLRFPDEFVRHKALDAVGDLSLIGYPVLGHLEVVKSGHALNHLLVREILSDASQYELVSSFDEERPRVSALEAMPEPLVA